jgi:NADPH:quinone reductase-like Zn-dependent oxidoreductase
LSSYGTSGAGSAEEGGDSSALSPFVSQMPTLNFSMPDKKNQMVVLKQLMESGKLTPVIDRTYSLGEVPEAIRYLEEGYARGKVIITV